MFDPRIVPLTADADRAQCATMMVASSPWNRLYFTEDQCAELLIHPAIRIHGALLEGAAMSGFFVATMEHGSALSR